MASSFAESDAFTIEAVDLGLPSGTKWASANVGANRETDFGLFFMKGDIEGFYDPLSDYFYESNYKDRELNLLSEIDLAHDAARANMGGSWRIPTKEEYQELISECNLEWTDDYNGSGVSGAIFSSRYNGASIFFPNCYQNNYKPYSTKTPTNFNNLMWVIVFADNLNNVLFEDGAYAEGYFPFAIRAVCE